MNEHIVTLGVPNKDPSVRFIVQTCPIPDSDKLYFWQIPEVCQISGYASEELAIVGAKDTLDALFFAIAHLGIMPDTQLVLNVLKYIVTQAGG